MPKTFPIRLEVEEIALGAVLRKLNDMPGIAKLDLDLGHGGQGPGKRELDQAAQQNGETVEQRIVKLLLQNGPMHIRNIAEQIGSKTRAYGATHQLRKKGIAKAGPGKGMHQLTARGSSLPALPAPPKMKHGPAGRALPGSGPIMLRSVLDAGALSPAELRGRMAASGMSPKSISGVLERAKRHGLIKKNGEGYELTAKGQKVEIGAPS